MAGFYLHSVPGVILSTTYLLLTYQEYTNPWWIGGGAIIYLMSIISDVDSKHSHAHRFTTTLIQLLIIITALLKEFWLVIILATLLLLLQNIKHRRFTHTYWFGVLLTLFVSIFYQDLILAALMFTSYVAHLIIDQITTKSQRTNH